MVRIPSFTRRSETAAGEDINRDGRIDARDDRLAREQVDDRAEASRLAAVRERERERDDTLTDRDRTTEVVPAGPRPRASMFATLGLVVGVASALAVLTGVLAGYGLALGVLGLLLSIFGLAATGKRHVAGKSDAMLGAALSIGAMVVGALALTGSLDWLSSETNKVDQLRQWLDTNIANRF